MPDQQLQTSTTEHDTSTDSTGGTENELLLDMSEEDDEDARIPTLEYIFNFAVNF